MRGFAPSEVGLARQAVDDGAFRMQPDQPSLLGLNHFVDALNK